MGEVVDVHRPQGLVGFSDPQRRSSTQRRTEHIPAEHRLHGWPIELGCSPDSDPDPAAEVSGEDAFREPGA
jgi:hypothetical protein